MTDKQIKTAFFHFRTTPERRAEVHKKCEDLGFKLTEFFNLAIEELLKEKRPVDENKLMWLVEKAKRKK